MFSPPGCFHNGAEALCSCTLQMGFRWAFTLHVFTIASRNVSATAIERFIDRYVFCVRYVSATVIERFCDRNRTFLRPLRFCANFFDTLVSFGLTGTYYYPSTSGMHGLQDGGRRFA